MPPLRIAAAHIMPSMLTVRQVGQLASLAASE
jgi:hypothetical protein